MKKRLNKIIAMLLISGLTLSSMSINSFAAVGTSGRKSMNRGSGQTALYQEGSLSAAYSEEEASEKYSAPAAGTYEGDLYQALKNFEDEINVSKYKIWWEDGLDAFRCLVNSNPDLFFVSGSFGWYQDVYCETCGGYVAEAMNGGWILLDETFLKGTLCNHNATHNCKMCLTHLMPAYIENSKTQLAQMTDVFNAEVEKALAGIDESMSDLEKALYCHDYIIKTNAYDYKNFLNNTVSNTSHSAYGALVLKTSVCDGYSLAFSYLMKQCGINARLVTSSHMAHAWNAVEIDGSWYFLDLTHDDPVCSFLEEGKDGQLVQSAGDKYCLVEHGAFLASEELWRRTEYGDSCYYGWAQIDIECNNKQYDYAIWKTNKNEYSYCDDYWYYLQPEYIKGDVDNSGELDSKDALEILKYSVGLGNSSCNFLAGYVNEDNTIDSKDALEVLKCSVGIIEEVQVEDAAIMRTEDPAMVGEKYLSLAAYKDTWGNENGFWPGLFSNISVYAPEKTLYFNAGTKVYTIDLTDASKNLNVFFDINDDVDPDAVDLAWIFGLIIVNDDILLGVQENPNLKHIVLEAPINSF